MTSVSANPTDSTNSNRQNSSSIDDSVLWEKMAGARTGSEFCQSWLSLQCEMIGNITGGVILFGEGNSGHYNRIAVWPTTRRDTQYFSKVLERVLATHRSVVVKLSEVQHLPELKSQFHVAYPLLFSNKLYGVIALETRECAESFVQAILKQLYWGSAWIELLVKKLDNGVHQDVANTNVISALDIVSKVTSENDHYAASLTFVTELASYFDCARVSIGFIKNKNMLLKAVSYNAQFNKKANIVRIIESAQEEVYDQGETIVYPLKSDEDVPLIFDEHEKLIEESGAGSICSIPLEKNGEIIGVVTLEKGENATFSENDVLACETVSTLVAPILDEKRINDKNILIKIGDFFFSQIRKIIGPRHVGYKLSVFALLLIASFLTFTKSDFKIKANAEIEGQIQRVVSSPFAAYVAKSDIRAGYLVKRGDVLVTLDDKDLRLEQIKLRGQRQQLDSQYREALSKHDRAELRIAAARMKQVDAQLDFVQHKLDRSTLLSPIDGIIVKGDLSQSLGAPVEKGEVLFEVAPLESYRIILSVDERDISYISPDLSGTLVLTSLPDEELDFVVSLITPVSAAKDGANYFRVEAKLGSPSIQLRPGMKGVGHIIIGQENIFWIRTYKIVNWLKLWLWLWLP